MSTPWVFPVSTYKQCREEAASLHAWVCVCVLPLCYPLPYYTKAEKTFGPAANGI